MSTPSLGRVVTAMVTPMRPDGSVDLEAVAALARFLVDEGNDGLVVNGTTGESSTTTDDEKAAVVRTVVESVGARAAVVAGVGTNDTAHTIELARQAEQAGATGLLVVTPYYARPTQDGLVAHFTAVADASGLPVMLYDIPARSGVPITAPTMIRLAEHPRIVAVKDAKGDFWSATKVMAATDLAWYSGNDGDVLLHLALGATGFVGVTTHVASRRYADLLAAWDAGDAARARDIHRELVPAVDAMMGLVPGAVSSKAALVELGVLEHASVRLPYVEATPEERARIVEGLRGAGLGEVVAR